MQRRYETIGGTAISIEDYGGTGPPVILIHGLGGSAGNWSVLAPRVAEFARAIAIDLPGHGRSGPVERHDLDAHVRTVIEVAEHHGFDSVSLAGNSLGGLVSQLVAAARPDLVRSLLLLSPATPPTGVGFPSRPGLAARLLLESLPVLGPIATAARVKRTTPTQQVHEAMEIVMHAPSRLPQEALDRAVELASLRRTMPWAARAFSESAASVRRVFLHRSRFQTVIDSIRAPTTLMYGCNDEVVVAASLRWLAHRRPDWRSIELPDAGHVLMLERPDLVARELRRQITSGWT